MSFDIKQQFVTFQQAKKLKELEFSEPVFCYYDKKGELFYPFVSSTNSSDPEEFIVHLHDLFEDSNAYTDTYSAPEVRHVADWLLQKHKIWIRVDYFVLDNNLVEWDFELDQNYSTVIEFGETRQFNSLEEAYSAAITYVLENLI